MDLSKCSCPGCAIRLCTTFQEWTYIRRLTVVPNTITSSSPPFLQWSNQKESEANKIFKCLNLIKCSEDRIGIDFEVRKVGGGFIGSKGKGVFVERLERNWLVFKMVSFFLFFFVLVLARLSLFFRRTTDLLTE